MQIARAGVAVSGVLALLTSADHGRAEPIADPVASEAKYAHLIRELMPFQRKGASRCFEAHASAVTIDVEDSSRVRWVEVEGRWRDGQQAKVPIAAVERRKLKRVLIEVAYTGEEPRESGPQYTLWASVSLEGQETLYSGANCSYQTNRLKFENGDFVKNEKGEYVSEAVTPQISCGVDCEGGGLSLFYVDGAKPAVRLRFHDGGMRMSGGCAGNSFMVGGEHDADGQVKKSTNSRGYIMNELPAKACQGLEHRAVDAMNKSGE